MKIDGSSDVMTDDMKIDGIHRDFETHAHNLSSEIKQKNVVLGVVQKLNGVSTHFNITVNMCSYQVSIRNNKYALVGGKIVFKGIDDPCGVDEDFTLGSELMDHFFALVAKMT